MLISIFYGAKFMTMHNVGKACRVLISMAFLVPTAILAEENTTAKLETRIEVLEEKIEILEQLLKTAVLGTIFSTAPEIDNLDISSASSDSPVVEETIDPQQQEQEEYMAKIELYDLTAKYYETYRDEQTPGVSFKLKNTGARTLDRVQVTVYFLDDNAMVIHEDNFLPVLNNSWNSTGSPLRPNYIWQMERGKFYSSDSVPSEWKEGAVTAKVTEVEFHSD